MKSNNSVLQKILSSVFVSVIVLGFVLVPRGSYEFDECRICAVIDREIATVQIRGFPLAWNQPTYHTDEIYPYEPFVLNEPEVNYGRLVIDVLSGVAASVAVLLALEKVRNKPKVKS